MFKVRAETLDGKPLMNPAVVDVPNKSGLVCTDIGCHLVLNNIH